MRVARVNERVTQAGRECSFISARSGGLSTSKTRHSLTHSRLAQWIASRKCRASIKQCTTALLPNATNGLIHESVVDAELRKQKVVLSSAVQMVQKNMRNYVECPFKIKLNKGE